MSFDHLFFTSSLFSGKEVIFALIGSAILVRLLLDLMTPNF